MVRIYLGSMPVILADIIEHLTAAETDLAVVGRFDDGEQSLPAALAAEADVLVLQRGALSDRTDSALAGLLATRPLAVLVLSNDGKTGDSTGSSPVTSGSTPSATPLRARCVSPRNQAAVSGMKNVNTSAPTLKQEDQRMKLKTSRYKLSLSAGVCAAALLAAVPGRPRGYLPLILPPTTAPVLVVA